MKDASIRTLPRGAHSAAWVCDLSPHAVPAILNVSPLQEKDQEVLVIPTPMPVHAVPPAGLLVHWLPRPREQGARRAPSWPPGGRGASGQPGSNLRLVFVHLVPVLLLVITDSCRGHLP